MHGARELRAKLRPRRDAREHELLQIERRPCPAFVFREEEIGDRLHVARRLLIATAVAVERMPHWRANPLEALRRDLATDDTIGPLVEGASP